MKPANLLARGSGQTVLALRVKRLRLPPCQSRIANRQVPQSGTPECWIGLSFSFHKGFNYFDGTFSSVDQTVLLRRGWNNEGFSVMEYRICTIMRFDLDSCTFYEHQDMTCVVRFDVYFGFKLKSVNIVIMLYMSR